MTKTPNPKTTITYRGWARHFIAANICRFRLNTLIECGNIRVVVSTVGLMENIFYEKGSTDDIRKDRFNRLGWKRHFETMAFHAKFDGKFWDADVQKRVFFSGPWAFEELDSELAANDNHIRIVQEIADKLEKGELLESTEWFRRLLIN